MSEFEQDFVGFIATTIIVLSILVSFALVGADLLPRRGPRRDAGGQHPEAEPPRPASDTSTGGRRGHGAWGQTPST